MLLAGYQKMTLIDYPGKIASTVFTVGCNFRCPFCHNPELVDLAGVETAAFRGKDREFLDFLAKRKGKLDGVCITGGEPTVQPDIVPFMRAIRSMGFSVKLDSNGTRPEVLGEIFREGLADYVAMDIKNGIDRYAETVRVPVDESKIRESIRLIMESGIPYEFRTTVVPGIHTDDDFDGIADLIEGADAYYLQEFRDVKILAPELVALARGASVDLDRAAERMRRSVGTVGIRK
ncbi:MAG: anaerobic ribonucleoside-triphosphate reductase activating protein [Candidatus Moranbacteria bacterium]|nr:anaerobic ribonucleoside-triphosphate reductase activating protein [Candidatus Moranbacteria bacterium]NTW46097.1 anaerobic ribonucleoside-triphosphate reductase activating protein [Candidatus Moranbacteria bacterium]